MEFIRGIYDVETSGETDKISMRGSKGAAGRASELVEVVLGLTRRLISNRPVSVYLQEKH